MRNVLRLFERSIIVITTQRIEAHGLGIVVVILGLLLALLVHPA
jgi:hypothetical protein